MRVTVFLTTALVAALVSGIGANAQSPTPPVVSNVNVTVRGNYVDVTYDLEQAEGIVCTIRPLLSKDNGQTYSQAITTMTGDAFHVRPGVGKKFTWNAYADYPGIHFDPAEGSGAGIRIEATTNSFILLPGNISLELVRMSPGTFLMGRYPGEQDSISDEDPQHTVTVPEFWIGKYEVTTAQWCAVMNTGSGDSMPVAYVTWESAQTFLSALNTHIVNSGQGPGTVRLPSEAEWEYACRAGATTRFYWGDDPDYVHISGYAWYMGNSEGTYHAVGGKQPNGAGLYDMSGNLWEWCEDDWGGNYTDTPTDGSAWICSPRGTVSIIRGGAWNSPLAQQCRSAVRGGQIKNGAGSNVGFRVVAIFPSG